MKPVILAIDQGTTNTKGLLVAEDGTIVARAARPMAAHYPHPGWAELAAEDIWHTVRDVIAELAAAATGFEIAALAISNQRESIILWDGETGKPVGPCVLWQCRRSSESCAALRAAGFEADIVERTGLGLDPLFPATKLAWLIDHAPDGRTRAEAGALRAGTVDSWLVWNLTGGNHVTDASNAARTQLFNLATGSWDPALLDRFAVPAAVLPEILASDGAFGTLAAGATALPAGVPVRAVMGDSHAALYGHGIEGPGRIKATCGTGSSLMMVTAERIHSQHGLSSTIAWRKGAVSLHALEGNILVSGQTAAFATTLLGLKDQAALTALAETVETSDGVVFVPALAGLGAPHWCDTARGLICGMSLGTQPAHIARAALEAIALQIHDVFRAMEADLGAELPSLSVDGGATRNHFLMQLLADLIERPVLRGAVEEVGAIGAARLAAQAIGLAITPHAGSAPAPIEPAMDKNTRAELIARWQAAVWKAKSHPT